MKRCKALLFLAVIIALVTVVPVMAECTVRPKGCTQLVDGEEVYVKFWSLQDCIDIMGPEFEDSCIISYKPIEKKDGDTIEKALNLPKHKVSIQSPNLTSANPNPYNYYVYDPNANPCSIIVPLLEIPYPRKCKENPETSYFCNNNARYNAPGFFLQRIIGQDEDYRWNSSNNMCECVITLFKY